MRQVLNDHALIPIGLAVVVIGGGAIWLTTEHFQGTANAMAITQLISEQKTFRDDISEIKQGQVRMETLLNTVLKEDK